MSSFIGDPRTPPMGTYDQSSFSSPTTSLTAVSRSSTPDTLITSPYGQPRKVFGVPMSFTVHDDEKALPGPGPTTSRHRRLASLSGIVSFSRRRRRYLGHIFGILVVVSAGGIWLNGLPDMDNWTNWSTSLMGSSDDTGVGPDMIVNESGTWLALQPTPADTTRPKHPNRPNLTPPTPIQIWGTDLSSDRLTGGLASWPDNPPHDPEQPPLSSLGHFADNIYNLGPLTLSEYSEHLHEFVKWCFPAAIAKGLQDGVDKYLVSGNSAESWSRNKNVWQTDKNRDLVDSVEVRSWRDGAAHKENWRWDLMTDAQANNYVEKMLKGSRMEMLWRNLPSGIHRSDTLRYLLLLLEGGIYSDTDTNLLKSPSHWGGGARLFRDGAGWLDDESLKRMQDGENANDVLGPPSVIVGVEADVGDREDWNEWWPRPMQIVQWTMASAPNHPIALSALLRILHATSQAIDWAHDHATKIKQLNDLGRYEDSRKLLETDVLAEPKQGGPFGVMSWTGPGVWTDAVLSYLRVRYGILWTDLRGINVPLRIGEVVILPVTGFSPGVGNFGSQPTWDKEAMVEHRFRGSWKVEEEREAYYMGATRE